MNTTSGSLFLDASSIDLGDIDMSPIERAAQPLVCIPNTTQSELATYNPAAWCVIVNKIKLDRTFFEARPDLRLVCIAATGTNNVDLEAAREHHVNVLNCQGYSAETVAQHVLMLILMLLRSSPYYQLAVKNGDWSHSPFFCVNNYPIRETRGLKLGIIGLGEVGRQVARLAAAFGMQVLVAERRGGFVAREGRTPFDEVLQTCDVISLHCPLTTKTEHLIDERALQLMRRDAFLINTARGALVDEASLLNALRRKWIAGAAVDVLTEEPPPSDHPLLAEQAPNLIVTPHCAWASRAARQTAIDQTAENVAEWLLGSTPRLVV